jgi:hypothetical protein
MPIALHSIIELFALAVIGLGLALKLRWMGWLTILKHKRTMLKVSVINTTINRFTIIDSSILHIIIFVL